MSLEQAINDNTTALRDLIAKLGAGTTAASIDETAARRGPGRPAKVTTPSVTLDMVQVAAKKLRDEGGPNGKQKALALIKAHGAERTGDMDPSKYASFIAAVDVALAGGKEEASAEEDEI